MASSGGDLRLVIWHQECKVEASQTQLLDFVVVVAWRRSQVPSCQPEMANLPSLRQQVHLEPGWLRCRESHPALFLESCWWHRLDRRTCPQGQDFGCCWNQLLQLLLPYILELPTLAAASALLESCCQMCIHVIVHHQCLNQVRSEEVELPFDWD